MSKLYIITHEIDTGDSQYDEPLYFTLNKELAKKVLERLKTINDEDYIRYFNEHSLTLIEQDLDAFNEEYLWSKELTETLIFG